METKKRIVLIPADELKPHPQNPRQGLGDLTELEDSIKENGILQNLTVVQDTEGYTVIIGHRRLAAAKQAGMTELPCVIADMTPSEQIKTMLMENMMRTDLTPIEQADGFQMMMDLGASLDEIVEQSGFSRTTIRHRMKLRELDRQSLEDRLVNGATLMDLIKLEQIKDVDARNKALESVGTNNFEYAIRKALDDQEIEENKPEWIRLLDSFARKITKAETREPQWRYHEFKSLSKSPAEYEKPSNADTETYGYNIDGTSFMLYRLDENAVSGEDIEQTQRMAEIEKTYKALIESSNTAHALRLAFVQGLNVGKKHVPMMTDTLIMRLGMSGPGSGISTETLADLLNIKTSDLKWEEARQARYDAFGELMKANREKALLYVTYAVLGDREYRRYVNSWHGRFPTFKENSDLDATYDFLEALGYKISDEETLLMSGKHPLFAPGRAEEEAEQTDDEE